MRKVACVLALACAGLTGCAAPHQIVDRDDYLAEGVRSYAGETRERVIRAAEAVLKVSDPKDWDFRYSLHGFTGLRRYMVYAVLASAQGREKWEFLAEPDGGGVRASVSISEAGVVSGSSSATPYEGKMASVPLYRLFWNRVDYMLGRRADWVTCTAAEAELEKTNTNTIGLSGLCGTTSEGRDAEPPQPMPRRPVPAQAAPKRKRIT